MSLGSVLLLFANMKFDPIILTAYMYIEYYSTGLVFRPRQDHGYLGCSVVFTTMQGGADVKWVNRKEGNICVFVF